MQYHEQFRSLFKRMLADIAKCQQFAFSESTKAEQCYWITLNYWEQLKKVTGSNIFLTEEEEIYFFKRIKPRFTGYINYFIFLSESLQCVPDSIKNQLGFWQHELRRYHFYRKKHLVFIQYFEKGYCYHDRIYFKQLDRKSKLVFLNLSYDSDKKFCSSHDWIIRGLIAHKMYYKFTIVKLRELRTLSPK